MNKKLLAWSHKEYSDLPWRKKRSLYGTLVSEIMLQQTTVATVLKHFDRFLDVFPNIKSLAVATEDEVCAQWQGLGYYRRARNLHKAACYIVDEFDGEFPCEIDELKKIPGIGDYTASALISIGMDRPALAIDANLERVLSRFFLIEEEKGPKLQKLLQKKWNEGELNIPLKKLGPRSVNEALMDLGRVFCQARRADCLLCPLQKSCAVFHSKRTPVTLPIQKEKKKKVSHDLELLRVVVISKGKVLGYEKNDEEWLSGQIEIPTFTLSSDDQSFKQYPLLKFKKVEELESIKTAITKYKIINRIMVTEKTQFQDLIKKTATQKRYKYYLLDGQKHHFSTTTLKCFRKLGIEV